MKPTSSTGLSEEETNSRMLALSLQSLVHKPSRFISPSRFDLSEMGWVPVFPLEKPGHKMYLGVTWAASGVLGIQTQAPTTKVTCEGARLLSKAWAEPAVGAPESSTEE